MTFRVIHFILSLVAVSAFLWLLLLWGFWILAQS